MVRFLHTSDWQMGMRAVHTGRKSKEIRLKRYETAQVIVQIARERKVDFVIIAGDLFEHHDVDEVIVKRTVDILNQFDPIPVFILPGNHDPYIPGGIWDRTSWHRIGPHVNLLSEESEFALENSVLLFPCPVKQKRNSLDLTAWIPEKREDNKIRIGIAHGSLDVLPNSINFPISKNSAEDKGLDYLALGDWHSFFQHNRCVYPGTFEPTNFDEKDSGNVVLVDISAPNALPKIEKILCNSLIWSEFSQDIQDITDLDQLEKSIKTLGPLPSLVLRINLRIQSSQDDNLFKQLETLRAELDELVFYLKWDQEEELFEGDDFGKKLPEGLLQNVNNSLDDILSGKIPESPCNTFSGQDRVVVQKAKNILLSIQRRG